MHHFAKGKGTVSVDGRDIAVIYPRRAHNPILRNVPRQQMPVTPVGNTQLLTQGNFWFLPRPGPYCH